uniref:Uncharacterized protein LOC111129178 isoform X2 n=1 Tax=Crassostrea virginica TaxID=6565 RepID=A0A8B8DS99_CRAVI|nr:uncharacterized protein LOC111129178 isoform X2 [Crassostrea virginica]
MSVSTFDNEKRHAVNQLILDYAVFVVWNDYVEQGSVDCHSNRELIQWIISQEPEKVPQTYILYLLCRLNDGENYLNKYSEESTLTVLEDAAEILEIFLTNVKQSFQKEGKDLLRAVKEEAVYVCCRDDNFETAKEVYSRLFLSNSKEGENGKENINKDIQKLLKSKSPVHFNAVNLHKYEDFLTKAKRFLQHFINLEEPYLMAEKDAARMCTCRTSQTSVTADSGYGDRQVNLGTLMKVCEEMGVPKRKSWPNFMEHRSLKEHLQKVNADKNRETNSNINANTASSPEKRSSPRKRKFSDSEDTAADKSLSTRVQEKASLNSKKILDFEIPKMATRGDQSSPAKNPLSPVTGKRNPWLEAEVDDFYQAVLIFGVGNWSQIRDAMKTARTNVQLKDKWRTILKCGEINRLKKQFGDVRK